MTGVDGSDRGIDRVVEVLNEDGLTLFDATLKNLNGTVHGLRGETGGLELVLGLSGSDPGNTLQLRVDHQGVTVGAGQDGTVFDGDLIVRQLLGVPLGLLGVIGQNEQRVVAGR